MELTIIKSLAKIIKDKNTLILLCYALVLSLIRCALFFFLDDLRSFIFLCFSRSLLPYNFAFYLHFLRSNKVKPEVPFIGGWTLCLSFFSINTSSVYDSHKPGCALFYLVSSAYEPNLRPKQLLSK